MNTSSANRFRRVTSRAVGRTVIILAFVASLALAFRYLLWDDVRLTPELRARPKLAAIDVTSGEAPAPAPTRGVVEPPNELNTRQPPVVEDTSTLGAVTTPDSSTGVPCPPGLEDALDALCIIVNREGLQLTTHSRFPPHVWTALEPLMTRAFEDLPQIEALRRPALERALAARKARGDYFRAPNPMTIADPEARQALELRIAEASRTSDPNVTVVTGGNGREVWAIPIAPDEDGELRMAYDALNRLARDLAIQVKLLIHPYTSPR